MIAYSKGYLDAAPQLLWFWSSTFRGRLLDPKTLSNAALVKRKWFELIHSDKILREKVRLQLAKEMQANVLNGENRILRQINRSFPISLAVAANDDGFVKSRRKRTKTSEEIVSLKSTRLSTRLR